MNKVLLILGVLILGLAIVYINQEPIEPIIEPEYTTYSAMEVKCQNFCEDRASNCVLIKSESYGTLNDFDQFYCERGEERTMYPLYPKRNNNVYEIWEYIV